VSEPKLIDGKAAAARVLLQVREDVAHLHAQAIQPALAVILVGNDPASQVYVRNKVLRATEVGIHSLEHRLPDDTSTEQLLILIGQLNADPAIHGILLQLPLPAQMDELRALEAIAPDKDVDGFHSQNVGGLSQGRAVLTPCTPGGCLYLLEQTCGDLRGKHAVVVGRSNIVGKPMAALLLKADCSVTVLHSRSHNAQALCRQADIVIAAVGRPRLIDASC
jgi:methylenetetrahydrofolate dehydrogenase (NADP+)/methenyltetrahydrofolate cyclohydrolase